MKKLLCGISMGFFALACTTKSQEASPIIGTWQLISGTTIKGKDTTFTDYTKGQEMIKIITPTHFSFLRHDLNHGKDSTADYSAGGGRVKIEGKKYKEYLDYFNVREWEGGEFEFDYEVTGDTLIIKGVEKVEKLGINHINIEKYLKKK
jgi:lipopolysaccharide export system protein LptA